MATGDPLGDARTTLGEEVSALELEAGAAMSFEDAVAFLFDDGAAAATAA